MVSRILSVFFRLSGSLSKFVLFLYLGRSVETAQIGVLGIVIAVIAILVQGVGFELHYVNSREIASASKGDAAGVIRGQLVLHLLSYCLLIPVLSIIVLFGFLDWTYFLVVFSLIIIEHLGQELFRFLQFRFRPVLGSLIIFLRSGVWVFIFIGAVEYYDMFPSIKNVLKIWLLFAMLAVAIGAWFIRDLLFAEQASSVWSFEWAGKLLKRTLPFLISTVCFSLFQYLDRFVLNYILGPSSVGIFFFLASLASVLQMVVTFSVGVFYGPLAIRAFRQEGVEAYAKVRSVLVRKSIVSCLLALIPALLLIYPVLNYVGKLDYISYAYIYFLMLIANVIMIGADFANLDLYVRNLDMEIMFISISTMFISLGIQIAAIVSFGVAGAAVGAILSASVMWIARRYWYAKAISDNPALLSSPRV